ncbi:MAG: tetratricopeptide repeat protein [Arenimonas sp.]
MIYFVSITALLVLLALGFITYPLLKTQRKLAFAIIIGLPLMTFGLYRHVGNPQAFNSLQIAESQPIPDINTAIAGLQKELETNPNNLEGWVLLARTQMTLQNFEAADQAFAKAIALEPGNPDLKTERAEAMMRSSDSRGFPDEAVALLKQALAENPEHERAMFFMGMHYLQQSDLTQAEIYLNRLLPKLEPEAAAALLEQINIARAQQNKTPLETKLAETPTGKATIKLIVSIDKSLTSSVTPGSALFVFAKSVNGGGPPVAAKRIEANTFPIQLELSDADSLMPTSNLSSQEKVAVSARISLQGIANAQAGDIEADAVIVETKSSGPVEIKLSRVKQ